MMYSNLFVHMFAAPQLNSIYQSKPPVSRAKMASITKQALNAIKVTYVTGFAKRIPSQNLTQFFEL